MARIVAAFVIVALVVLSSGCMTEGRKASQEYIDQLAQGIQKTYDEVVQVSRVHSLPEPVARLVTSMNDDAEQILKWTMLTKADMGRSNATIDLDPEIQAEARADYKREIDTREAIKGAAARAGLPIGMDDGSGDFYGGVAEKGVAGIIVTGLSMLLGQQRKKRKLAEAKEKEAKEDAERKARAVREAISVIGQSKDTKIRETAAMKKNLLQEFAKLKMEDYEQRIREIDNGTIAPPQGAVPTAPMPGSGASAS